MNEKLQYATMLEIPVSTCNVTFKPIKKKNRKRKKEVNPEAVKQQLMNKINAEEQPTTQETAEFNYTDTEPVYQNEIASEENASVDSELPATVNIISAKERRRREKGRFSVIGVQLAVIGVLIATCLCAKCLAVALT